MSMFMSGLSVSNGLFLNELAVCSNLFSTNSRTYIFYGMCTVTKCIIAIVNGTFCY